MAVVKFSSIGTALQEADSIKSVNEKVELLKRDLQYILNHLDAQNLSKEFVKKNNLK